MRTGPRPPTFPTARDETWHRVPPHWTLDELDVRVLFGAVMARSRMGHGQILGVARDDDGVWYAITEVNIGPTRAPRSIAMVAFRDQRHGAPTGGVHYRYWWEWTPGAPVACPAVLLAQLPEQSHRLNLNWRLACYRRLLTHPADLETAGAPVPLLRALDPPPLDPTTALTWAREGGPLLRHALAMRPDTPASALDVILAASPAETDVQIASHAACTAEMVSTMFDSAGRPSQAVFTTLVRHPNARALLAAHWETLLRSCLRDRDHGYLRRIAWSSLCPPLACARVLADARALPPAPRVTEQHVCGRVLLQAVRLHVLRRHARGSDRVPLIAAGLSAFTAGDLPRLLRDTPHECRPMVTAVLRASTDPAIVAALTATT